MEWWQAVTDIEQWFCEADFGRNFDGAPEAPKGLDNRTSEPIEFSKLEPKKQREAVNINHLQEQILRWVHQLRFESEEEKESFIRSLQKEQLENADRAGCFKKLPEFGPATKAGYKKLVELLTNAVPQSLLALDKMQLAIPPGCPLKIVGQNQNVFLTNESFRQSIGQGHGYLDIDTNSLSDVHRLALVTRWLADAAQLLQKENQERYERFLSEKLEAGIKEGRFPEQWRRPEGMDKQKWCVAVNTLINFYERSTRIIEALDHLHRSKKGFRSDALANLPSGIKIERDPCSQRIKTVSFGPLMTKDLEFQSDDNQQKLARLSEWCDKYERAAVLDLKALLKDHHEIAGYGEAEVPKGWVNIETREFVAELNSPPSGKGWVAFNLISYDLDIKETKDAFGTVESVQVTTDCSFQQVPWYGYLNSLAETKFRQFGKPVTYAPDHWLAVQTGPGNVQMIQAKELRNWKTAQTLKQNLGNAITLAMDVTMIASGTIELRAAGKIAQLGLKECVQAGGKVLKTDIVGALPSNLLSRQVAKGTLEVTLGATGIFHNSGAHEQPWMKAISDARTVYFLTHAGCSISKILRTGAERVVPGITNAITKPIDGALEGVLGCPNVRKVMQLAKSGVMEKLPLSRLSETSARASFASSEKAFMGLFLWDAARMYHAAKEKPQAVHHAAEALRKAQVHDVTEWHSAIAAGARSGEVANILKQYKETLGNLEPHETDTINGIIQKIAELGGSEAKAGERQKYLQELIKHVRFDGKKIADLQTARLRNPNASEYSETELDQLAQASLNPKVRKIAALAMLALTRLPDGTLPEFVTERKIKVDKYSKIYHYRSPVVEVQGPEIVQKISSAELVELLKKDLAQESSQRIRLDKARVLNELGLTSTERVGDLLLSRVEGKDSSDKQSRIRAVCDAAALIKRLQVEESLRGGCLGQATALKLSSADLLKRLEDARSTTGGADDDVRATILFVVYMLKREHIDHVDTERFARFILKDPAGITKDEIMDLLQKDAAATPCSAKETADNRALRERKLLSSFILIQEKAKRGEKPDLTAATNIVECLKDSRCPDTALMALKLFTSKERGPALVDLLEKHYPETNWRREIMIHGLNLFDYTKANENADQERRTELGEIRIQLIQTIGALTEDSNDSTLKGQLHAHLRIVARLENERFSEVRCAAIRQLAASRSNSKEIIDVLERNLDPKIERDASVRLASVEALEQLLPLVQDLKERLGKRALSEPDPAVRAKLGAYYEAGGSNKDAGSQRSRQDVQESTERQNKVEIKETEVIQWLQKNAKRLLSNDNNPNIFDYFDPTKEMVQTLGGRISLKAAWESAVFSKNSSSAISGPAGMDRFFEWELEAQNRAFKVYGQGIDELLKKAMNGSTATVSIGNDKLSERDVALLALGVLVRQGSRMGQPFFRHRAADALNPEKIEYRDYTEQEKKVRAIFAKKRGWDRTAVDLEIFVKDPWPVMEMKIAGHLRDLCSQSSDSVDLKLLREQILEALKSKEPTDGSRVILVEGLDRLLSRPDTDPEVKREILAQIMGEVKTTLEVNNNKSESTVALLNLFDKHKDLIQRFGREYIDARIAVESRCRIESKNSTPEVRVRARELYNRAWVSVLAEHDRISPTLGTARSKADLLNFDSGRLHAADTLNEGDERVHDAVQRIILATKGCPFRENDKRIEKLELLTDSTYNPRVRMAALIALAESKEHQNLVSRELWTMALECPEQALRQDAVRVLERLPAPTVAEFELVALKSNLKTSLSKILVSNGEPLPDLNKMSNAELISLTRQLIAKHEHSGNARLKKFAEDAEKSLHRYAESLALLAAIKMRSQEDGNLTQAGQYFEQAMRAWGLDEKSEKELSELSKESGRSNFSYRSEISAITETLLKRHQLTGSLPFMIHALNDYAKLSAMKIKPGQDVAGLVDRAVGMTSLAEVLSQAYYPLSTPGRAETFMQMAQVYHIVGEKTGWYGQAEQYYEFAQHEYDSMGSRRIDSDLSKSLRCRDLRISVNLQILAAMANLSKPTGSQRAETNALSKEVERELQSYPRKDSFSYQLNSFVKTWIDLTRTPPEQKTAVFQRAEQQMKAALEAAEREFGVNSEQYKFLLAKVRQFYLHQNQREKAEAFFGAIPEKRGN